jgi:DNA-binding transcriptional LysR family regulator
LGISDLPDFIVGDALASGALEAVLQDWSQSSSGVYLVTPPGGPRPARVEVLLEFLADKLAATGKRARKTSG